MRSSKDRILTTHAGSLSRPANLIAMSRPSIIGKNEDKAAYADRLEHPQVVADRIVRYAQVIGRENVIAGTDCGLGGRVHPQIAWAKLEALSEGAKLATKELWS